MNMKNILKVIFGCLMFFLLVSCSQTMYINKKEFTVKQINLTDKKNTCEYVLYNTNNKKIVLKEKPNKYQINDVLILVEK